MHGAVSAITHESTFRASVKRELTVILWSSNIYTRHGTHPTSILVVLQSCSPYLYTTSGIIIFVESDNLVWHGKLHVDTDMHKMP